MVTGTGGLEQNLFSDLSSLDIVVPKQKKEKIVAQSNSSMCSRDTVMNTIWKKGLLDPAIQLVSSGHGQMGVECECELSLRYRDLTSTGFSPGGSQGMSSLGVSGATIRDTLIVVLRLLSKTQTHVKATGPTKAPGLLPNTGREERTQRSPACGPFAPLSGPPNNLRLARG